MQHNKPINMRVIRRVSAACAMLAAAFNTSTPVRADVTPFVDNYKTNTTANTTPATNAVLNLLNGYSQLWAPGAAWNTGTPTAAGASIIAQNLQYVVNVTQNRTQAQADHAYLIDRRNQSYSAIEGLGNLASAFRADAGAKTTIGDVIPANALIAKYDDKGTGAGDVNSASLGQVVTLVNTLRGNYSSTTPPKNYFSSPRPWRLNDSGQVVGTGTETTGYYTSTLADGSPNLTTSLTYFPAYQSNVSVVPTLMAVRSTTPASDGGFASGHTNAAYLASIALAYATPQRFDSLLLNASEIGDSRIVAGMHSPLEVIGGRLEATALAAAILNDSANSALKASALSQAQTWYSSQQASETVISQSQYVANKALYTQRMTYGLSPIGDTTLAASVPKGAEVLIESRFAYLDAAQRREVLRTTAIASGNALDDAEGWNRLNLYAASGGYGRFDSGVTVNMNAALGGLNAKDYWRNDISGTGGLTKQGSGMLVLTGNNTYTGATRVQGGKLVVNGHLASAVTVESGGSLGGNGSFEQLVMLSSGGRLASGLSLETITFNNGLTISDGAALEFQLGPVSNVIRVTGGTLTGAALDGGIALDIASEDGFAAGTYTLIDFTGASTSSFNLSDFAFGTTVSGYDYALVLNDSTLQLSVTAIPEPSTYALMVGLSALGVCLYRRRQQTA